jgi:hypothetical protein
MARIRYGKAFDRQMRVLERAGITSYWPFGTPSRRA